MNVFRDVISAMANRVEGAVGALIIGMEGMVLERSTPVSADGGNTGLDFEIVAAEYTSLLKTALRTAEDVEVGMLQELTVISDSFHFLIRMISEEYYLMLVLQPGGNLVRARYELKKARILLEREFQI